MELVQDTKLRFQVEERTEKFLANVGGVFFLGFGVDDFLGETNRKVEMYMSGGSPWVWLVCCPNFAVSFKNNLAIFGSVTLSIFSIATLMG